MSMRFFRFVFPFLFVRNWYSGEWEFSQARAIIFGGLVLLLLIALVIAYHLQTPPVYEKVS